MGKKCCNYPWITLFYSGEEKKNYICLSIFLAEHIKKRNVNIRNCACHEIWYILGNLCENDSPPVFRMSFQASLIKSRWCCSSIPPIPSWSSLLFFFLMIIDENFKDKHYNRQLRIAQQRTRECITRSAIAIPQWHRYVQRWRAFSKRCLLTDVLSEPPTDSPLYVPFLPRWSFKFAVT